LGEGFRERQKKNFHRELQRIDFIEGFAVHRVMRKTP
jgi:hypothetical protein